MRYALPAILCLLITLCCVYVPLTAQQVTRAVSFAEKKQRAITNLKNHPSPDTARINALINLLFTAVFLKERQELLPYQEALGALSRALHNDNGLASYHSFYAGYYKSSSDYPHAITHFDSALAIIAHSSDTTLRPLRAHIMERKGMIYFAQENYHPALNCFFEALRYDNPIPDLKTVRITSSITEIYTILYNSDKAMEYANRNIRFIEQYPALRSQAVSVYNAAINLYLEKNDLSTAALYLEKLAPFINNPEEKLISFGYYMKRGHIQYRQQQYADAFLNFQQANRFAMQAGNHKESISSSLRFLSATALKLGNHAAAKLYAERDLDLADTTHMKAARIEALTNLAEYHDATGHHEEAYKLVLQAMELKDSLMAENNIKQINVLGAMYEREEQEKKIARLQQEKEVQQATTQQQSLLNKLFIISIFALLLFGYLGYVNFRKSQQLAVNQQALQRQQIIELEKDRQLLSIDAMLKGQEEERGRIAKDLHDGLGGLLSGTKLSFMTVKDKLALPASEQVMFDKSLSMLDNTIEDLRKVAQNLMPGALMKYGLYDALRDFCDHIRFSTGIHVEYQQFGTTRKLDNTASIFIYRIVQELVNNVVKHAEAKKLIVQLTIESHQLRITVEDDGKGFDKTMLSAAEGAGMSNIEYRVQYLHGRLDMITSPGNGTSVNIELIV